MLKLVDADFVMLQEVGSLEVLEEVNADLQDPYAFVGLIPGNSNRSIHLGVLSRYRTKLTSHKDKVLHDKQGRVLEVFASEQDAIAHQRSAARMQRDVLQVNFRAHERSFVVFGVHLKSAWTPGWMDMSTDVLREAEARCVTRIISDYQDDHPDEFIVLLGDFNDSASSDALAPIRRLQFVDAHQHRFKTLGRHPTTYWPRRRSRIDRIYVSPETADLVVEGSEVIHAGEMAKQASDHYPVSIVLNVNSDE